MAHAPFLPVRSRDAEAEAAHPHRRIRRVRIGRAQIEASEDGVLALRKRPGSRELRTRAVRLEYSGKADALGVVATMAERRLAALRRERVDELVRRKAVRRKPPRRVSERGGGESNDRGDQRERSNGGTRCRLARLGQNPISIELFREPYQRSVWRSNEIARADESRDPLDQRHRRGGVRQGPAIDLGRRLPIIALAADRRPPAMKEKER